MDRSVPTFRSLPLWPLPLLAALVPLLAAHLAWALSLRADLIPACNPYWDGCVSISRAARHGLGHHLFRLALLPCAAVHVLCWLDAAHWPRPDPGNPVLALHCVEPGRALSREGGCLYGERAGWGG